MNVPEIQDVKKIQKIYKKQKDSSQSPSWQGRPQGAPTDRSIDNMAIL